MFIFNFLKSSFGLDLPKGIDVSASTSLADEEPERLRMTITCAYVQQYFANWISKINSWIHAYKWYERNYFVGALLPIYWH